MTVEIGSDGMLIAGVEEPPALGIVTASVDWPVRLGDGCPLRLIVVGRVLLAQDGLFEMAVERHEFRTAARGGERDLAPARQQSPAVVIPFPLVS